MLEYANLRQAILIRADLNYADLRDAILASARGIPLHHDSDIYGNTLCPNGLVQDTDRWAP